MAGLKGQTGASTYLERPQSGKQKKDHEEYKKEQRKKRQYYKVYYCSKCNKKLEKCLELEPGIKCCNSCFLSSGEFVDVKVSKRNLNGRNEKETKISSSGYEKKIVIDIIDFLTTFGFVN